jgi:reductive dehalogenase
MARKCTFEENYPVKDSYKRYDSRGSTRVSTPLGYKTQEGKKWRIDQDLPGFSLLDYAFREAAYTANHQSNGEPEGMNQGYYSWSPLGVTRRPEGVQRWEASPDEAARVISKAAKYYGALDVRFTEVDERWFFSHTRDGKPIVFEDMDVAKETNDKAVYPKSHKWAIVMTVPIDYEETLYTPTPLFAAGGMAYSRMHILAGTVAEFIRGLGWNAIPSGNDMTFNVPLALQAGIGHLGRMNRIITWKHGPLVKVCKVFTDMPLPQSPQADSGILEFCNVCKKCSIHCPGGSIGAGPRSWDDPPGSNPGVFRWPCDEEKCRDYWDQVGTSCTICYRVCAFTKKQGAVHSLVKWFIRNVPQLNRFWVWSDELMGYGKMKDPKGYWN